MKSIREERYRTGAEREQNNGRGGKKGSLTNHSRKDNSEKGGRGKKKEGEKSQDTLVLLPLKNRRGVG